jgi:hypothetical protein
MSEQMSAFSFSILPAMLSGPTAFRGLMLLMSFSMPFLEIEMFFMIGCVLGPLNHTNVTPVKGRQTPPSKLQANISNLYFL